MFVMFVIALTVRSLTLLVGRDLGRQHNYYKKFLPRDASDAVRPSVCLCVCP